MITKHTIAKLVEAKLVTNLSKRSRKRPDYYPRIVYFKLCTEFTNDSLESIGTSIFYDHPTVINAVKRFEEHSGQDYFMQYDMAYNDIKKYIENNFITSKTSKKTQLKCIEEVEQMWRVKAFRTQEKYHRVISNMNVLKQSDIIQKVAELEGEDISEFEKLAEVFYKRKRAEKSRTLKSA